MPLMAAAQGPQADTLAMIDQIMSKWNEQTPGGVLTVFRNGQLYYQKAFGMADLEHQVPNTTASLFEAGSVSKQFTATAVLLLANDKKLSLDDDVRKYVPELPAYSKPITIRHLLNHTSGLRDWGVVAGIAGWERTTRVYTQANALDYISRQKGLNHAPGERYLYSNSNYTLLCFIAERVSGQKLPEFTAERIFKPLGMTRTQWRNNFRQIIPGRTVAYSRNKQGYEQTMPFENTYGHAALLTTTEDLSTWNQSWAKQAFGNEVGQMRITQGILNNGKKIAYAGGVFVNQYNGLTEISHSGATAGYRAWMAWYPGPALSVVCLSNDAATSPIVLSKKVTALLLGAPGEKPQDTVSLTTPQANAFTGIYKNDQGHELLRITASGKTVFLADTIRLQASSPSLLLAPGARKLALAANRQHLQLITADDTVTYTRVQPYQPSPQELNGYTGTFFSAECNATQQVALKNGRLVIIRHPSNKSVLTPAFRQGNTVGFTSGDHVLYLFDQRKPGFMASASRAEGIVFTRE